MVDALNTLMDPRGYMLPYLNGYITGHAKLMPKIPTIIAGLFKLNDVTLDWYNDYALVGATPVFIKPNMTSVIYHDEIAANSTQAVK